MSKSSNRDYKLLQDLGKSRSNLERILTRGPASAALRSARLWPRVWTPVDILLQIMLFGSMGVAFGYLAWAVIVGGGLGDWFLIWWLQVIPVMAVGLGIQKWKRKRAIGRHQPQSSGEFVATVGRLKMPAVAGVVRQAIAVSYGMDEHLVRADDDARTLHDIAPGGPPFMAEVVHDVLSELGIVDIDPFDMADWLIEDRLRRPTNVAEVVRRIDEHLAQVR